MEENLEKYMTTNDSTFINKLHEPLKSKYLPLKCLFDIIFGILLFIPSSIVILFFMALVRLETPGKCFYSQKRVGLMGKTIVVTKLRSMYSNAEKNSGAVWAKKNDDRVTRVGHFMRKTRIDELPQLLSVIRGDMSLIGPRPERPEFTEKFSKEYPGFEQRLRIKPGLSGYAQVHGGYDIDPGKKAELDRYYIENIGLQIDSHVFFETIKTVITGEGAR
ncbi:sugar transferase [Pediococcus parvulus]|uniref:sugar transferase n=1 Tax=Pediococcus parvulus TaxID=54062 RepID=UPI003D02790E